MGRTISRRAALLLGLFALPTPVAAIQDSPAAKLEAVRIPFAPPLGRTLVYRAGEYQKSGGQERQVSSAEIDIIFRRAGAQFAMDVAYRFPGAPPELAADPAVALLSRPMTFQVNADGEIVGVEKEEAYWSAFEQVMAQQPAGANPGGAEAARKGVEMIRDLPAEARLTMLSARVAPLLAWASANLPVGQTIEGEEEGETPFGPLPQHMRLTVEKIVDGRAHVVSTSATSPAQLEAAIRVFTARTGGTVTGGGKVTRLEQQERYEVDTGTGLAERYRSTTVIEGEEAGKRTLDERTQTLARVR